MGNKRETNKNSMTTSILNAKNAKIAPDAAVNKACCACGDSRADSAGVVSIFVDSATMEVRRRAINTVASSGIFRLSR